MRTDDMAAILTARMGVWHSFEHPANDWVFYPDAFVSVPCIGFIVPVPGSELRIDFVPDSQFVEQYLAGQFLKAVQVEASSGARDHASGRGYTITVPNKTRLLLLQRGRYWYLMAGYHYNSRKIAETDAKRMGTDCLLDWFKNEWLRRHQYGDFRMVQEPRIWG
jgi:hypothetical protein